MSAVPAIRLPLSAAVELDEALLRVSFRVENPHRETALVAVRALYPEHAYPQGVAVGRGATPTFRGLASRRPYTTLNARRNALLFSLATYPIPPGLGVYAPFVPLMARVPGAAAHEETLETELPVAELHPYCAPEGPTHGRFVSAAFLVVEWMLEPDARWIDDRPGDGLLVAAGVTRRAVAPLGLPRDLPVLERTGDFFRAEMPKEIS